MTSVLSRYVARTVMIAILGVLLVVVSLDVISAIVDQVGDIRGDYTFVEVLRYVGTTLPGRLYENIPFAALIGCMLGLGLLANSSELVVMRSAGVSLQRIVAYTLKPVMVFIAIAAILGELAVPYTEQLAEGRRAILLGKQDRNAAVSGFWNREQREFIHVRAAFPDGVLAGLTRYHFDENGNLNEVSFARKVRFRGDHWLERQGVFTRFDGDRTEAGTFESREWWPQLSPDVLRLVVLDPESLPLRDLYYYARYQESQGQDAGNHWLAFWQKILQPLTTLSLVMIAVSFIFGPLRESTTGFRIFAGVVTGIIFSTSQKLLGPASLVYGFAEFWSVLVPILFSMALGGYLLRRAG